MQKMLNDIEEITFEITNRCNLQCKICNIWKENKKKDTSLENIKKILESFHQPLAISLTGGEPLLHPDFDRIYKYIYKLFLQKKVKNIDISTNAYSTDIINFLSNNKRYLQPLTLSISLDGLEKNHNKQRGKKDAFSKTLDNIMKIKKYNITPTIKFVITDMNYKDLPRVHKLSESLGLSFNCKLVEKINSYYHRYSDNDFLSLSLKNFPFVQKIITQIYRKQKNKKNNMEYFSLSYIKKFLSSGNLNFIKKCATPEKSLFVTSTNGIYSCLYQEKIGDTKNWPNLNWEKHEKILNIAKNGKCLKCLSYHGYLREFNYPLEKI